MNMVRRCYASIRTPVALNAGVKVYISRDINDEIMGLCTQDAAAQRRQTL